VPERCRHPSDDVQRPPGSTVRVTVVASCAASTGRTACQVPTSVAAVAGRTPPGQDGDGPGAVGEPDDLVVGAPVDVAVDMAVDMLLGPPAPVAEPASCWLPHAASAASPKRPATASPVVLLEPVERMPFGRPDGPVGSPPVALL
jgi:hypothetical protein